MSLASTLAITAARSGAGMAEAASMKLTRKEIR